MLRTTWLVHEDAVEGVDYDIDKLTSIWNATNTQDAWLAANNQLGVESIAYTARGARYVIELTIKAQTDGVARAGCMSGARRA